MRNAAIALTSLAVLLTVVLGCDSAPWSRFIVANSSSSNITVRFYTQYVKIHWPCLYTPEEWKAAQPSCQSKPRDSFRINEAEDYFEAELEPDAAVEIDRARYPDVEENIPDNFVIYRLEIRGPSGDISLIGKTEVFHEFKKEGGDLMLILGRSPRYVYYYR